MRADSLLDAPSADAIGFDWLVAAVAPVCAYGERVFAELRPFDTRDAHAAQQRAQRIVEFASQSGADGLERLREALRGVPDATGAVAMALLGDVLADVNLFELQRFCKTIARVDELLGAGRARVGNDAIGAVALALEPGRTASAGFYLADAFDDELAHARAELARASAAFEAARGRELERLAKELGRDDLTGHEFIVMRSQLRGALPPGARVVREAPTYLLCVPEHDDATLVLLEHRELAAQRVAEAEEAVRTRLSAIVRERSAQLEAAARALGEYDVLISAARFTVRYACTACAVTDDAGLTFVRGRFLPMVGELEAAGRSFMPLDIDVRGVAVLTGPNMGGKSVCLRTGAFIAMCAAFGLPVPAERASTALFDEIAWVGIGGEDRGGLLSSFAKEIVRVRDVFERKSPRLLMLADEFARTTTPQQAKALVVALAERLRERGAQGLLATHLAGVARDAGARHFSIGRLREMPSRPADFDLNDALAALAASMDYSVREVEGLEESHADAIALSALLGMDDAFVAAAYRALGQ